MRKIWTVSKRPSGSSEPKASGTVSQRAETSTEHADEIMNEIRALGYFPTECRGSASEKLAFTLRRAIKAKEFSTSQLEELEELKKIRPGQAEKLMEEIRALGYIPKRKSEHDLLAQRWNSAVRSGKISSQQKEEAEALTAAHTALRAQSMDPPPEACAPPEPLDAFAEEAANRLEQDLLMAVSGMRTKQVMRRIRRYKKFFDEPALHANELVLQYKAQMDQASQTFTGCDCYVPGDTIEGDALRTFASEPRISGPIVCQLCDNAAFLY